MLETLRNNTENLLDKTKIGKTITHLFGGINSFNYIVYHEGIWREFLEAAGIILGALLVISFALFSFNVPIAPIIIVDGLLPISGNICLIVFSIYAAVSLFSFVFFKRWDDLV